MLRPINNCDGRLEGVPSQLGRNSGSDTFDYAFYLVLVYKALIMSYAAGDAFASA